MQRQQPYLVMWWLHTTVLANPRSARAAVCKCTAMALPASTLLAPQFFVTAPGDTSTWCSTKTAPDERNERCHEHIWQKKATSQSVLSMGAVQVSGAQDAAAQSLISAAPYEARWARIPNGSSAQPVMTEPAECSGMLQRWPRLLSSCRP